MGNFNIKRGGHRNDIRRGATTPVQIDKKVNDLPMNLSFLNSPFKNSRERNIINKWEKITGKETIIISFVSDPPGSDFYSKSVHSLVNTVDRLGYDYIFHQYECDRNYFQNCCYKPVFIEKILKETGKNLIWIDGDTSLKNGIDSFFNGPSNYDIGLVSYNGQITGFVASPIFFVNTDTSRDLISKWASHCEDSVENGRFELDHDALKHVILPSMKDRIKISLKGSNFHKGDILDNVNSIVPHKVEILREMARINSARPFIYKTNDFIIL
jgi:hypothetical protein